MVHTKKKRHFWSDALCDVLLHSIPKTRFAELLSEGAAAKKPQDKKNAEPQELIAHRARRSRRVQRDLMRLWRLENAEVVSAADVASLDGPVEQCEALLRQFGAETVLLELITDQHEDGWELARSIVKQVRNCNKIT